MTKGAKLDAYLQKAHDNGFFNGNWLLMEDGAITSQGALGIAHPYRKTALNLDTVFEMASVSKHITATAIMILRDRKALDLSDSMSHYFPSSSYSKDITLRHMLNHTSGLPAYDKWLAEKGRRDNTIYPNSILEIFLAESSTPALFSPGDKWDYCNTAYALLALIVEKVSGKSFAAFLQEEIFKPCGMNHSQVYHRRMNGESISNYAYGMVMDGGEYKLPDEVAEYSFVIPLDGIEGDGIVNSTIEDMLKWDAAMRASKLLRPASWAEMLEPARLNDGSSHPYGFGWELRSEPGYGKVAEHTGGWPGYRTKFLRLLDKQAMLVYMINQTGFDDTALEIVRDGMERVLFGKKTLPIKSLEELRVALSPEETAQLCGNYQGKAVISANNDKLMISCKFDSLDYEGELVPVGGGVFWTAQHGFQIQWDGETLNNQYLGSIQKG